MAELGEPVGAALGHKTPNAKCPFCPPKARKSYTSFPGDDNNSTKLATIMESPGALLSEQSGARPQTRAKEETWVIEQSKPRARKQKKKWYTFQAHHLISGKQAMKGNPIEKWIVKSGKLKADTGYSINNTYNGFWAPSVPIKYQGQWAANKGKLTNTERQDLAEEVMDDATAQIHIGPHNIKDPDDPRGHKHNSYDKYLKKKLKDLAERIDLWAATCLCEAKKNEKPRYGTHRVHDAIDAVSDHMQGKIDCGVKSWDIYLSKYALAYHKKPGNCRHGLRKRQ